MLASRTLLAAALAAAVIGHSAAEAAVIPGLFNTGVDENGLALLGGNGVVDPHYVIVASTTPGLEGQHAVTYRHPAYAPDDADSRWVSLSATGAPGANTTTYRLTFSLAGLDPATALITGAASADNLGAILLNGVLTPASIGGFGGFTTFNLGSGFVAGVNTLDFQITDQGAPTAFRVDNLAGTASSLPAPPTVGVPEPATWAMMLAGFFGAGGVLRSRRRRDVVLA